MRSLKMPALITLTALLTALLLVSTMRQATGRSLKAAPADPQAVTATFTDITGQTFVPDQVVHVKWTLDGSGVKALEQDQWSECELMFSSDGGATWSRISPEMSVLRRSFDWLVPKLSTQQALIQLRIGTQGASDFYFFPSPTFTISAPWEPLK